MKLKNIKYKKSLLVILPLVVMAVLITAVTVNSVQVYDSATPTAMTIKVFKASLHTDVDDTTGVTIFTNATGVDFDVVANKGGFLFGEGEGLAPGEYARIKLTVENSLDMTVNNPCTGDVDAGFINGITSSDPTADQVDLVFATMGDGGGQISPLSMPDGSWSNPLSLGEDNIILKADATTSIDFRWDVAGFVQCYDTNSSGGSDPADTVAFGMLTADVTEFIATEAAACDLRGEEYWIIRNTVRSHFQNTGGISNTMDYTNAANVLSAWGTFVFNATGSTVSVEMGKGIPDTPGGTSGMTEHRHMLLTLDKTQVGDEGIVDMDETFHIPYEMYGNEIIVDFGGAISQGGISTDCSTIILTTFDDKDADYIIAMKKPTTAELNSMLSTADGNELSSYDSGAKLMLTWPSFEMGFSNTQTYTTMGGSIYNADSIYLQPSVILLDHSPTNEGSDTMFEWRSITHFVPVFNETTGAPQWPNFERWISTGPMERVSTAPGGEIHSFLRFRSDGIANIADNDMNSFVAIGATGNVLVSGSAFDNSPAEEAWDCASCKRENHMVQAGLGIKAHETPTLAMLEGKWILAGLSMELEDGGSGWADDTSGATGGNERVGFELNRGIIRVDAIGGLNGTFTHKRLMTGELMSDSLPVGFIHLSPPANECFGLGLALDDIDCTGGTKVMTFRVWEDIDESGTYDVGEEGQGRFIVDQSGSVMTMFDTIDDTGTPFATPEDNWLICDRTYDPYGEAVTPGNEATHMACGDAANYINFFTLVKVE